MLEQYTHQNTREKEGKIGKRGKGKERGKERGNEKEREGMIEKERERGQEWMNKRSSPVQRTNNNNNWDSPKRT